MPDISKGSDLKYQSSDPKDLSTEMNDQTITSAGEIDSPTTKKNLHDNAPIPDKQGERGNIVLEGVVASSQEKEDIEQAVRSCAGVIDVENKIQVAAKK